MLDMESVRGNGLWQNARMSSRCGNPASPQGATFYGRIKNYPDMKKILTTMMAGMMALNLAAMAQTKPVPGTGGDKYVPYEERIGNESVVYFTRDLSAEGLIKAYEQVCGNIEGETAVKLHTGEQNGPNIIPHDWVESLIKKDLPDARIVETNTYYTGDRYTTEQHRQTLKVNGWTFCPVDIMDEAREGNGSRRWPWAAILPITIPWWF